jgi:hypothetical protein
MTPSTVAPAATALFDSDESRVDGHDKVSGQMAYHGRHTVAGHQPAAISGYAVLATVALIAVLGGKRVGALRQHRASFQLVHDVDWNRDIGMARIDGPRRDPPGCRRDAVREPERA